ncbi:hypothetical protein FHX14_006347 [Rhizobium sp. BK619]|uniref:hypothetical protein n=1 Tax=Rhizobium sp. BK619 TaxID=2586989 RepID=UPI00160C0012|nr:hypothetical protein [Rhizobium sp. BK619]MBB3650103.1 hypothetical protein [Rhizobium sp. BK619]
MDQMAILCEIEIRRILTKKVSEVKTMCMIGPAVAMRTVARGEHQKTVTHRSRVAQTSDDREYEMTEIVWKIDEGGMLLGARAHDARLISLEFVNRHRLLLTLRRVDGSEVKLSYEGIQEISLGRVWDDTLVIDIFIWSVEDVPTSQSADVGWNALFQGRADRQHLEEDIKKIANRDRSQSLSVIGFVNGTSTRWFAKPFASQKVES